MGHASHQLDSTASDIKRILFADGGDPKFRSLSYYGSDEVKGGRETFWQISFFTIQINEPLNNNTIINYLSDIEHGHYSTVPRFNIRASQQPKAKCLDEVDK